MLDQLVAFLAQTSQQLWDHNNQAIWQQSQVVIVGEGDALGRPAIRIPPNDNGRRPQGLDEFFSTNSQGSRVD